MQTTGQALANQFGRAWEMLRATILRIDDVTWQRVDSPGRIAARSAVHAIETADFYPEL